jgi:hypothetical protein
MVLNDLINLQIVSIKTPLHFLFSTIRNELKKYTYFLDKELNALLGKNRMTSFLGKLYMFFFISLSRNLNQEAVASLIELESQTGAVFQFSIFSIIF